MRVSSASAPNALRRDKDHAVARKASEGGNHGREFHATTCFLLAYFRRAPASLVMLRSEYFSTSTLFFRKPSSFCRLMLDCIAFRLGSASGSR